LAESGAGEQVLVEDWPDEVGGSDLLGQEIYTHVTPPMQSDAAERVANRIFKSDHR